MTIGIAVTSLIPRLGMHTVPANPLVAFAGALSLAYGCLRTSRPLGRRRKEGVATGAIFLAAPLGGYLTGTPPGPLLLGATLVGLGLVASVWRHLDRLPIPRMAGTSLAEPAGGRVS
jgi:hypothetical protein